MTEVALKDSMPLYFSDYNPFSSPACLPLDTVEMLPVYDSLSCVPITQRGGVSDLTMGLLQFHQSPPDFLVNTLWLWEWLWVGSRQGRLAPWALFRAHKLGLVKEIRRDGGGMKVIRLQKHTWPPGLTGGLWHTKGPGAWGR